METKPSPKMSKVEASCVLPVDIIMLCILTRLPVKSILRFKSVCKPWLELFSTREFVKMHRAQFSSDPKNETLVFQKSYTDTLSLFIPDANKKKPTSIVGSFYEDRRLGFVDFVGCCNGLICMVFEFASNFGLIRKHQEVIHLWNPALKLFKSAQLEMVRENHFKVSLGFGYDAEGDDFKVVRIVGEELEEEGNHGVVVYSANSDSWTSIEVGFEYFVFNDKNDVIVNGNPYWVAMVGGNDVLLRFDVTKMVFETVPVPEVYLALSVMCKFVDLNGSLGVLVWSFVDVEMAESSLDIWVFGDGDRIWRKTHSLGPIQVSVYSFLVSLKNGNVVGNRLDGEMFVFDPENGCVNEIAIDEARKHYFEAYGYTESLTHIEGMIKEVTGRETRRIIDDRATSSS